MKSRKFGGFFGSDFFGDEFFADFEKIFEERERNFADQRKSLAEDFEKRTGGQPLVYGFSLTVTPDGKPNFQQFGNMQALPKTVEKKAGAPLEREPLTEVQDAGKELRIVAELPGVDDRHLKIKPSALSLDLKVTDPDRPFAKTLRLPTAIAPNKVKHVLKNGILEITLPKK
jgi:HSP20 family protein